MVQSVHKIFTAHCFNRQTSDRKVASSRLSQLVAHLRIFRLFMKGKFDAYVLWPLAKKYQNWIVDRSTEMRFASLFSGGFITTIVVNQPERKLAKRTSVRSTARKFLVCIKVSHDFFRSKSRWEWKICPKYWRFCQNFNM